MLGRKTIDQASPTRNSFGTSVLPRGSCAWMLTSPPQVWSEAEVAFSVELTDASVAVQDGTAATAAGLQLPDEQALYRGLFWQVLYETIVNASPSWSTLVEYEQHESLQHDLNISHLGQMICMIYFHYSS